MAVVEAAERADQRVAVKGWFEREVLRSFGFGFHDVLLHCTT